MFSHFTTCSLMFFSWHFWSNNSFSIHSQMFTKDLSYSYTRHCSRWYKYISEQKAPCLHGAHILVISLKLFSCISWLSAPFSKCFILFSYCHVKINFAWDTISTNVLGFSLSFFTDQIAGNFTWFASELHILLIMEVIWCTWFGLIYIIFWLSYTLAFWPLHLFKGRE